jgi:hypothetical protein
MQSPAGSRSNSVFATVPADVTDVLEPSIINIHPSEELTRLISDFIFLNLNDKGYENLEVLLLKYGLTTD